MSISHETIYCAIYAMPRNTLRTELVGLLCQWHSNNPQLWHLKFPHPSTTQRSERWKRKSSAPGEQAQVDWGQVKVRLGEQPSRVHVFVMTLGYSRRGYAEGYLNERMDSLLSAHERAFAHFGGVCQTLLYDRMRTVTIGTSEDDGQWVIRHKGKVVAEHTVLSGRAQLSVLPEHGPGAIPRNQRQRFAVVADRPAPAQSDRDVEVRDLGVYDQLLDAVREAA
ncbi:DDE-type integrase/transposase/recombinase [Pseudorhodoferax sp. Leaf267]|uniref:DDE-type integrase/transposase/recombinase n=1 Tax=Pseudorhodoferax sp. Leaf267 TaxID=1736316 RepID=UPI001F41A72C|nr:DDE-type integrase/transposase/recombinase [Pseudorhodoferax sp. Leaf267]